MAFILSSVRYIRLASGTSRVRWMASNSQRVVHRPQPMHLFWSTTDTPQPRQRDASALTCASVKVMRSFANVLALLASWATVWRAGASKQSMGTTACFLSSS